MMSASHTPEETKAALHEVVTEMYDKIVKGEPPTMTCPSEPKGTSDLMINWASTSTARSVPFGMRQALAQPSNCCRHFTWLSSLRRRCWKIVDLEEMYYRGLGPGNSLPKTNPTTR